MLLLIGFVLFLVLALLVLLLPALFFRETFERFTGARAVTCPETDQQVSVRIDAMHAARTVLERHPEFRISDCSRWPERWRCNRTCLSDALQAAPFHEGEVAITTKRIYHLPVLLAAFVAWYIGAVWHSHFLFRDRWTQDLGLTSAQVKEMVEWYSPHLLSIAVCVLFAYGVAWLLALSDREGVAYGILHALLLGVAVAVVTSSSMRELPSDLIFLELTYASVAAIAVGAIIGGLNGKLVLPMLISHEQAH